MVGGNLNRESGLTNGLCEQESRMTPKLWPPSMEEYCSPMRLRAQWKRSFRNGKDQKFCYQAPSKELE